MSVMRKYEFVVVLRPSLKEADRKKALELIKTWLGDLKIVKEEDWGQKALAYAIKKEEAGYYYMWQLEIAPNASGEPESVPVDFETKVLRNDNVLRHLLLRTK